MKTLITIGAVVGIMVMPNGVANIVNNTADVLSIVTNKAVYYKYNQFIVVTKLNVFGQIEEAHNFFTGEPL